MIFWLPEGEKLETLRQQLTEDFAAVVADVAEPYPDYFHRKMPDIRRKMGPINNEGLFFDPESINNDAHPFFDPKLIAYFIGEKNAQLWLPTHALGYAKETLAITGYNTHHAHGETAYIRCLISLNEHGHGAFGPALKDREDIQEALRTKLTAMEPFKPGPNHPAAGLARHSLGRSL